MHELWIRWHIFHKNMRPSKQWQQPAANSMKPEDEDENKSEAHRFALNCFLLQIRLNSVGSEIETLLYLHMHTNRIEWKNDRTNLMKQWLFLFILKTPLMHMQYAICTPQDTHTQPQTLNQSQKNRWTTKCSHLPRMQMKWLWIQFATINQESRRIGRSKQWDYNCRQKSNRWQHKMKTTSMNRRKTNKTKSSNG